MALDGGGDALVALNCEFGGTFGTVEGCSVLEVKKKKKECWDGMEKVYTNDSLGARDSARCWRARNTVCCFSRVGALFWLLSI